eukprot:744611-Karenia_brevis.AAC.1
MGMDLSILKALRSMYANLRRRFKVCGCIGKEFIASNGLLQGCPISVILINALMAVWAHAIEAEVRGSKPAVYADDKTVLIPSRSAVTKVAQITQ